MPVNWRNELQNTRNQTQAMVGQQQQQSNYSQQLSNVTPMQPNAVQQPNYAQQMQSQTQQPQQQQQQYDPYYLYQMYNYKSVIPDRTVSVADKNKARQQADQLRQTMGVDADWARNIGADEFKNQYLNGVTVPLDSPHLQPYFQKILEAVQVARSSPSESVRQQAYAQSNQARAALQSYGIDIDNLAGWERGNSYSDVLKAYNQMYAQQQEDGLKQENNLIDDLSNKYGFDYSRDYAKSQAEAIAQAQRDAVSEGRKSVESGVMGAAENLDRNYFLQAMNQAQMQTDSGLNAGIAADQNLRMAMARQANLGEVYRDANLRNFELDNTAGRIEQDRIAYEDQLYNERLQQGFDNVQRERDFNLQEGQLTGRYTPEGVDMQEAYGLVDQLISYKELSAQGTLSPYERALNHARANEIRSQLAQMGADVSLLDKSASPDEIRANLGNLFNTGAIRDSQADRNQQQEQFDKGLTWEREQFEKKIKQENDQFKKQLKLSYDQLDQDMKQFLESMKWDKHKWNNMSAEQKEGFKLGREQLAEQKRQFNSEQEWRRYTYNNMSAAEKRSFDINVSQHGDNMAWRMYEFDANMAFQKGYAGGSSGNFPQGGTNQSASAPRNSALSKAKSFGLRMTSAQRTPAENKRVGGIPNSSHLTDKAMDFAGDKKAMDNFAKWAKSSGLFKNVLWQVKGHYDHVHVDW